MEGDAVILRRSDRAGGEAGVGDHDGRVGGHLLAYLLEQQQLGPGAVCGHGFTVGVATA